MYNCILAQRIADFHNNQFSCTEFSDIATHPEITLDNLLKKHNIQRTLLSCEVQREHLVIVSRLLEEWKEFARAAGLTEPEIVAIDRDEQTENGRRFKALHLWHKKNAFLATNGELIRILLCIGGEIAQKVCLILKGNQRSSTLGKDLMLLLL